MVDQYENFEKGPHTTLASHERFRHLPAEEEHFAPRTADHKLICPLVGHAAWALLARSFVSLGAAPRPPRARPGPASATLLHDEAQPPRAPGGRARRRRVERGVDRGRARSRSPHHGLGRRDRQGMERRRGRPGEHQSLRRYAPPSPPPPRSLSSRASRSPPPRVAIAPASSRPKTKNLEIPEDEPTSWPTTNSADHRVLTPPAPRSPTRLAQA